MGCFIKDYLDFMANFIEQKREAEEDLLDGDIDFSTEPGLGQLGLKLVLLGGGGFTLLLGLGEVILGNAAGGEVLREPVS